MLEVQVGQAPNQYVLVCRVCREDLLPPRRFRSRQHPIFNP